MRASHAVKSLQSVPNLVGFKAEGLQGGNEVRRNWIQLIAFRTCGSNTVRQSCAQLQRQTLCRSFADTFSSAKGFEIGVDQSRDKFLVRTCIKQGKSCLWPYSAHLD